MADSATPKKLTHSGASFARRYGLAFASVAGALLLDLLFYHFHLPHPFAAFALSAIAITFWYGGTKPGIVAVLLSSLIRGFIFEGETSSLSRVLYELVFLTFAIVMIWVRRRKEALEVAITDRTAELTAANEDLHKRKEQLDALFELSPDAVILTDENFNVLRVNKEFTRMFGYTSEEVAGKRLSELIVPEELRAEGLRNREQLISGNRVELETVRQRKDGFRLDVSVVARGISLGFDQVAVYLIYRDITERKKAERELRRSEGYLAESQKLTHTGSWAWNVRTGILFWSREIFSIYDYEYQEMGPTWPQFLERIHPEDRPQIEQSARMEASGKEWLDSQNDFRIILPNGTIKHLHSVAHSVRDDSGEITEVVGTVMDVTERKRAEEKLRRTEADLLEAQRISQTGSWKLDVSSGTVTVSPQIFRVFGVKPDEDMSTVEFWLSRNHIEDQKRIQELFEKSIIQKIDYEADYRIVLPNGAIKHLHAVGHPVLNESGDLVEFVGTAMDITERKQREEALRRSEGYLAEAQKLTHTGSWAVRVPQMENAQREAGQELAAIPRFGWDASYWSKEMYQIFCLDPGPTPPPFVEVVRRFHPEDASYNTLVVEQAVRDRTDFEIDYRLPLPNGAVKYIHVVGHPVLNASGDVVELVGTAMDVTEQHEARAALQTAFEQIKAEETE